MPSFQDMFDNVPGTSSPTLQQQDAEQNLNEIIDALKLQIEQLKLDYDANWMVETALDGSFIATPTLQALATAYAALLNN